MKKLAMKTKKQEQMEDEVEEHQDDLIVFHHWVYDDGLYQLD